jgi:hypothetical protein
MGLRIILEIVDQAGIVIDDIAALNKDATEGEIEVDFEGESCTVQGGISELMENMAESACEPIADFYKMEDGKLLIPNMFEYDMDGYGSQCEVWGCYGDIDAKILARHVTAGKIVLMLDIEGNDNEYFVITPGECKHVEKLALANF